MIKKKKVSLQDSTTTQYDILTDYHENLAITNSHAVATGIITVL